MALFKFFCRKPKIDFVIKMFNSFTLTKKSSTLLVRKLHCTLFFAGTYTTQARNQIIINLLVHTMKRFLIKLEPCQTFIHLINVILLTHQLMIIGRS